MPGPDDGLGKKAEQKIKEWLDKPENGYSFDRFYDQLTGYYLTSRNICDFVCFKSPYQFYIESKATFHDRFDFTNISDFQKEGLYKKSQIENVYGLIIVLFATYQKAFILNIQDIICLENNGKKSLNITKESKWDIPYIEIPTIKSRKHLLDYEGDLVNLVEDIEKKRVKL